MSAVIKKGSLAILIVAVCIQFSGIAFCAEYNVTANGDFTGPFSTVMPLVDEGRKALIKHWNDTTGKKLGIKLNLKTYDTRYDPALIASTWPTMLANDKPIAHLGLGTPSSAALMKRASADKVPVIMSVGTPSFAWQPNQWIFYTQPTYIHAWGALLDYLHKNVITDRPIRVGILTTKYSPAHIDNTKGIKALAKQVDWLKVVAVEWTKFNTVNLISEVRKMAKKKPDYIISFTTPSHTLQLVQALKALKLKIPLICNPPVGVGVIGLITKKPGMMEGHYDAGAHDAGLNPNLPVVTIYEKTRKQMGYKASWNIIHALMAGQVILLTNAVERAAAEVGPDNITPQAIYDAMYAGPFTEEDLLGLYPTLTFTKKRPFSSGKLKAMATTVKDGKRVVVGDGWIPVPDVKKWSK